ncbi:MAG: hypothetical protein Hens2KO_17520 [Henriciella sp.]
MKRLARSQQSLDFEKRTLLGIIALACLLVLATALQPWVDPRWLYMDTQTVGELSGDCCHIYDGAMSTLGIMLWASTAAISILACLVFARQSNYRAAWFAGHATVVSAVLALDDAFLLHEVAFPELGIPQVIIIGLIGGLILSYLWVQRRFFRSPYRWLLGLSLFAFAVSVGVDQVFHSILPIWIVVEDGPKFIGIVAWALLHFVVYAEALTQTSDR